MSSEPSRRFDLFALALLALNIFLAVAVLSFDPADPPSSVAYPPYSTVQNACGPLGAFAARGLFDALGLAAYFALGSLAFVTVRMLRRQPLSDALLRLSGWLLTVTGIATLSAMALKGLSPGPVIGAGGYLGAAGRGLLELYFATAGAYILTLSVLFGGLFLCTDNLMFRLSGMAWRCTRRLLLARLSSGSGSKPKIKSPGKSRTRPASKDKAPVASPVHVEVLTPPPEAPTAPKPKADDDQADDHKSTIAQRLAGALRIKNRRSKSGKRESSTKANRQPADGENGQYQLPPLELLQQAEDATCGQQEIEVRHKARLLEETFASFGFNVKVVEIETGPVIAQYEVELEAGLRLSKITGLADDLAVALRVPSVRVVAPLPGKNTVGIEVPNASRQLVRLREVMEDAGEQAAKMRIPIYLGSDVSGNPMLADLTALPHLLIAGRTGTGKSVCLNTIIMSMLMTRRPDEVKMLLVDPKMVELTPYSRLPHLMHPVVTDMKKAEAILAWAVDQMEERYALLMRAGVRHISTYNQLGEEELQNRIEVESEGEWEEIPTELPYVVIVADEMADLMMTAPKEVEAHIIRLAQKSRAVGIHLVLATQKPTVDVITGLIKSNLPARISFQVASRIDSRVVLDEMGADKLLGNGDMLFLGPGTSTLHRGQGAFVGDDEIGEVIKFLSSSEPQFVTELVELKVQESPAHEGGGNAADRDKLYNDAVDVVVREGRGSVSLLQRTLRIGYGRAARLIDFMADDGVVGPYNGSQAREVLLTAADWGARQSGSHIESQDEEELEEADACLTP